VARLAIVASAIALAVTACSTNDGGDPSSSEGAELTVFAASSLGDVFTESIGPAFEAAHEGTSVVFNFGASDSLAGQIQSEGTADVFASASGTWMDAVQDDPGVRDREDFVRNRLVIITPPGNPEGIASIDDLANEGLQLVLAAEGVPAGDYARDALANAGIAGTAEANVVSNEEDDASVVAKVAAGEADAGIVYASDISAAAGNDVDAIEIPDDVNAIATYPIAVVEGSHDAALAAAFVDYVTGAGGRDALETYGFEPIG
jgi:molybdate transport system substrate-binding protein